MTHRFREQARSHSCIALGEKTGATSDVAPAEENILVPVIAQTTAAATLAGRRDSKLTSTKLTSATARL